MTHIVAPSDDDLSSVLTVPGRNITIDLIKGVGFEGVDGVDEGPDSRTVFMMTGDALEADGVSNISPTALIVDAGASDTVGGLEAIQNLINGLD